VLALLAAPYLLYVGGFPVLVLGVIGVAASISYAGGICPYAKRGLADLVFILMFGIVGVVGTYYIQFAALKGLSSFWSILPRAFPWATLVVGLPVGALVTDVLVIDDIRDHEFDALKGWRTGAVRYGLGWSRAEFIALLVCAYLAPFCFWVGLGYGPWVLLPVLTLPLARTIAHGVRTLESPKDLLPMTPKLAGLSLIYSLLLAVGLAVSKN
jgi:1,4-dihydroxy-2-naphthoate octaprenyltransferase